MTIHNSRRLALWLTVCFILAAAAPGVARAQTPAQPQLPASASAAVNILAQRAATVLTAKKAKRVALSAFTSEEGDPTLDPLGAQIAAEFRASLEQQPHKFKLVSDADLKMLCTAHHSTPADLQNPQAAAWLLHQDEIHSWVSGKLSKREGNIVLVIEVFHRDQDRMYEDDSFSAPLGRTTDLAASRGMAKPEAGANSIPPAGTLVGAENQGTHGYGFPQCKYCPPADYSKDAEAARLQGIVILNVVVTADGRAEDIHVLQRMPLGLTDKAIDTVQNWTFIPATGPDGKPAAVRQTIEVQFHLN
jgi:TonB family protein